MNGKWQHGLPRHGIGESFLFHHHGRNFFSNWGDVISDRSFQLRLLLQLLRRIVRRNPRHGPELRLLFRIGPCTNFSSLDLAALNAVSQKYPVVKKELMVVTASVFSTSQPLESVEIQLALEGGELGDLEVLGKHSNEFLGLSENKTSPVRLP